MISFIGAGPGDPELLTIKGKKLIDSADVIIYAGSLVNLEVLSGRKEGAEVYNSALMDLDEVIDVMEKAEKDGLKCVRVHTGDLHSEIVVVHKGDFAEGRGRFCGDSGWLGRVSAAGSQGKHQRGCQCQGNRFSHRRSSFRWDWYGGNCTTAPNSKQGTNPGCVG